jgi:protein-S-isoprenylcysteine O-methyltransferase Ste14
MNTAVGQLSGLEGASMKWLFVFFFPAIWIAFLLYWRVKARYTKATQRLEPVASRIVRALVFLCAIALLVLPRIPLPWLYRTFLPSGLWSFFLGAVLAALGLLFAVWAREYLGANWSHAVTVKQDHQLITNGPYAFVRHPIYTGLLAGFLGSVIALAQLRGLIAFALFSLTLWAKLRIEEEWMRGQFGASYEAYSHRVASVVPFIL